ncbi:MAG: T9SS type A sorting domain-containing protein [Bacteroidetes bacterium]|nr:T9SS type A sorting domain-containing protein [Bacteroidota bacterium]
MKHVIALMLLFLLCTSLMVGQVSHPRLFFSVADLPSLRDRIANSPADSQLFVEIIEQSTYYFDHWLFDGGTTTGMPKAAFYCGIPSLAFRYLVTGESQWADRAKVLIFNQGPPPPPFVQQGIIFDDWHSLFPLTVDYGHNRLRTLSQQVIYLCILYDWLYDQLDQNQRTAIQNKIISNLAIEFPLWGYPNQAYPGGIRAAFGREDKYRAPLEHASLALLLGAITIYGENPNYPTWLADQDIANAVDFEYTNAHSWIGRGWSPSDGAHFSGVSYGMWLLPNTVTFLEAWSRWSGVDHWNDNGIAARLSKVGEWLAYEVMPDPQMTNIWGIPCMFNALNDAYSHQVGSMGTLLALSAKYPAQAQLNQWVFDHTIESIENLMYDVSSSEFQQEIQGNSMNYILPIVFGYENVNPVEPPTVLPQSRLHEWNGLVGIRTSPYWGSQDDIQFSFTSQPIIHPEFGEHKWHHDQADKNHFTLSAFGDLYLRDYGYDGRSSLYHNLVLVNGQGQAFELFYQREGKIVRFINSAGFDFIHGDATSAFNELHWGVGMPAGVFTQQNPGPTHDTSYHPVQKAHRYVLFARSLDNLPAYFIVADDISKNGDPNTYSWRFHSAKQRVYQSSNNIRLLGAGNNYLDMWFTSASSSQLVQSSSVLARDTSWKSQMGYFADPMWLTICDWPSATDVTASSVENPYFHVALLPHRNGDPVPSYSTLNASNGSILRLTWPSFNDFSILKHENGAQVTGEGFASNAKLAKVRIATASGQATSFAMCEGSFLSYTNSPLVNLYGQEGTVMKQGTEVLLFGDITCFRVYAPNATSVKLNDDEVPFVQDGDYVDGLLAFAEENKSCTSSATWSNSSRHIVQQNGRLHQLFSSVGDIIYRRQDISTARWDITKRISSPSMNNQHHASVVVDHNGIVHAIWQRQPEQGVNTFQLWYAQGADNGETWSEPVILPRCSSIDASSTQLSIYPVIAEWAGEKLVLVYCSSDGLMYTTSEDGGENWAEEPTGIPSQANPNSWVWYPSLASISDYLMLTYDYRYNGVWSRTFDGSTWSGEASVNKATGGVFDRHSSVSGNGYGGALAAWCAQRIVGGQLDPDYHIYLREHPADGKWDWFTEFTWGPSGVSDIYPSVSSMYWGDNVWGPVVLHQNNYSQILYKQYNPAFEDWDDCLMSSSGLWGNLSYSEDAEVVPSAVWTDQSSNPNLLALYQGMCGEMNKLTGGRNTVLKRRVVVQDKRNRSSLIVEMDPLLVVTVTGDTMQLPFKSRRLGQRTEVDLTTVWEYLGTETVALPSNAAKLLLGARIEAIASRDTLGTEGINSFGSRAFSVHLLRGTSRTPLWSNASGTSGRVEIDVRQFSGQSVAIRPLGTIPPGLHQHVSVSAGDVVIGRSAANRPSLTKAESGLPAQFRLGDAYPNPFNPSTTINFDLPEAVGVSLDIFDVLGRRVVELVKGWYDAGYHSVTWNIASDGSGISSGVYFVRFIAMDQTGNVKLSKVSKAVLVK